MENWTSTQPWQFSLSNTRAEIRTFPTANTSLMSNHTTTTTTSVTLQEDLATLKALYRHLDQVMPVTLSVGILGNVLAVLAFMTSPLKLSPLSHYLSALAIADVMNLLASLVLWVSQHGWNLYIKVGVCQITSFVLLMSRFLAVWYLLSAHVERLLVQFGRPGGKRWCSVFRTKCVILTVFILSLVAFLHYIWSHVVIWQNGHVTCSIMQESVIHINRLRRVKLVLALFLPMLLMLSIDVALLVKMVWHRLHTTRTRSARDRRLTSLKAKGEPTLRSTDRDYATAENGEVTALSRRDERSAADTTTAATSTASASTASQDDVIRMDLSKEKNRCTLMCIVMGVLFITLTLPSAYLRARISFAEHKVRFPPSMYDVFLMQVFEKVNQFTGLYKVLLYFLFLSAFRRAVFLLFKNALTSQCCRSRQSVTTV